MASNSAPRRLPEIKFRVLIIGRANAGKTTILQRVCDTTESPKVYRIDGGRRREVQLDPTAERGKHDITDELIFANHEGYIFHDSLGFEAGDEEELRIVQGFVQKKAGAPRLQDRLHAIWYCIPMDNHRPLLDMKYFNDICADKNVPIIAVFTKYDQFKLNVELKLEDKGKDPLPEVIEEKAKELFQAEYLGMIAGEPRYITLENLHEHGKECKALIEETADGLKDERVAIMLLAVQRVNLKTAISVGLKRASQYIEEKKFSGLKIVKCCALYFPSLWLWFDFDFHDRVDDDGMDRLDRHFDMFHDLFDRDEDNRFTSLATHLFSMMQNHLFMPHHIMIVSLLVLDLTAVILHSSPSIQESLELAYLQGRECGLFSSVKEIFPEPHQAYSLEQYDMFISHNRLET